MDHLRDTSPTAASSREQRRAAARERTRRQRRAAAISIAGLALVAALIAAVAGGGGKSGTKPHTRGKGAAKPPAGPVDGGPLAPLAAGGLQALWAPQNVVATQPGTAAAYAAASQKPGPGGYILIADRGNNRILVVSPTRRIVFRFPTPADRSAGRKLYFNDDTFVEPGGRALIANEEENHAIVEVGIADHSLRVLFGHPGVLGAGRTHLNTPDDAYTLPDGSFTVADAYNCRILFVRGGQIVRQYGSAGTCRHDPPRYLGAVNGDTPMPDGGVLVSEISGGWIDAIGPDGRLEYAFKAPVSYPSDPQPLPGGRILLADYASPGAVLILSRHGRVLWRYRRTQGYGRLDHPSLAMPLPNGNIAVNDDYRHRVVVIDPRQGRIVWQYGRTDIPGTSHNFLNTPDGMDFVPAGPDGNPDYAAVVHP
jgi:outer membrane protein assembly factor BamB